MSKSRVHTRISWRKESSDGGCSEEVLGEIAAELFEFTLDAPGFSSECSILLPSIYNMSVAERARFRFWLAAYAATPKYFLIEATANGCVFSMRLELRQRPNSCVPQVSNYVAVPP
jgi:hypothetical protein